jgi:hypothetical protein
MSESTQEDYERRNALINELAKRLLARSSAQDRQKAHDLEKALQEALAKSGTQVSPA